MPDINQSEVVIVNQSELPDGQVFVFCCRGDDLNQTSDLGLVVQTHAKQLDGGVVDVVVGGDHAQVERGCVHVLLDADALAVRSEEHTS